MPRILIILLFISWCIRSDAQFNNAIFNGGVGQGFNAIVYYSTKNNSIFSGAHNDGFDYEGIISKTHSGIFQGGIDDGFNVLLFNEKINSNIYYGGIDDGWSSQNYGLNQNSIIWAGGEDDGWSSNRQMANINNLVFNGGTNDGFSSSGISKMKWNGIISDEWLVAANWTPNIVPGKSDAAWIPQVKTHYPILKTGVMGLGLNKTYTCKELYIEPFASVTLNKDVGLISNGYLGIDGTLNFLGVGLTSFEVLQGAIMDIKPGGLLNIIKE